MINYLYDLYTSQLWLLAPAALGIMFWTTILTRKNGPTLRTMVRAAASPLALIGATLSAIASIGKRARPVGVGERLAKIQGFAPGIITWTISRMPERSFLRQALNCHTCTSWWLTVFSVIAWAAAPQAFALFAILSGLAGAVTLALSLTGQMPGADQERRSL